MSHAPYIMPDGRPLGQFLNDTQAEQPRGSNKTKQSTRRNRRADRAGGWTHKAAQKTATIPTTVDEDEDESSKLGRERRRRYLNEKILREMAGALTASDMEALFKPVPFGEERISIFTRAMDPDVLPVWDLFRNVDEDKQNLTLQRWELHLRAQRQCRMGQQSKGSQVPMLGLNALKAWSRVPRKTRDALKRCSAEAVEALEMPILEFLDQERDEEVELELELEDSYQRLLAHGLAVYHNLQSRTIEGLLRMRGPRAASSDDRRRGSPPITCSDIVFALAESPAGGLTAKMLDKQLRRNQVGSDADSEASYVLV